MAKNMNDAYMFFNVLIDKMTFQGPAPSLNSQGMEMLADVLEKKKVGRWDELMTDEELAKAQAEKSTLNDVAELIQAWHINMNEADKFITPPTEADKAKSLYRLVSQIFKTLKVSQDAPEQSEDATP